MEILDAGQYGLGEHTAALVIMLLIAFLLGMLVHWLFWSRSYKQKTETQLKDYEALRATISDREKDLKSAIYAKEQAEKDLGSFKASISGLEADKAVLEAQLARALKAVEEKPEPIVVAASAEPEVELLDYDELFESDNLQIIEGIGAVRADVLNGMGINTWADLANADQDKIKAALDRAEIAYDDDEIGVWQHQADLLSKGAWADLVTYQKEIDKFKRGNNAPSSKAERLALRAMGLSTDKSDLTAIEGIKLRTESILKDNGVEDWDALAASSEADLKKALEDAKYEYDAVNLGTWNKQASLAAAGDWKAWKALKDEEVGRTVLGGGLSILKGASPEAIQTLEQNGIGSIEALATADDEVLEAAFKNSKANWTYLKGQAQLATDKNWNTLKTYQKDPFRMAFRSDNLQIVEGIGPKIEGLLKDGGLSNWTKLATKPVDAIKEMLAEAGSRFKLHDPTTWVEQARKAKEGEWNALVNFQRSYGRDETGRSNPSKIEKLMSKMLGISTEMNDLKVVEGIGPKIEQLLKDADIDTWEKLARTTVDKIQEILSNAGDAYRLAAPTSWPKQAELAASGDWVALKEYQDFLRASR